ncbi:MAG: 8-amino-7-oxononanoate synthase [Planctomycetes bacterium]|nr:8-amino-7-oxononanoate synthase [Planctomycetota bacterium]
MDPQNDRYRSIEREIEALRSRRLYRALRDVEGPPGPWIRIEGREAINLSSNDYLGLAAHPRVRRAAAAAIDAYGCGSAASRLVSGNLRIHADLEDEIAGWKGTQAALLFSSGYAANAGAISALAGREDAVFSDRLNHASIVDGIRLSGARLIRYPHGDADALAALVERTKARRRLIVTDSVFSMDGDVAPLAAIAEIAERSGAFLMVDEAHAAGILGPGGAGLAAEAGVADRVDIHMGTLSKALGSAGGYIAGRREIIRLMVNRARSFIFSTGPAPAAIGAAHEALRIAIEEPERRARVLERARALRVGLRTLGLRVPPGRTPIIPVLIGDEASALDLSQVLLAHGILAVAIRPPAVPPGTARLRASAMATHSEADIEDAVSAFSEAAHQLGILS